MLALLRIPFMKRNLKYTIPALLLVAGAAFGFRYVQQGDPEKESLVMRLVAEALQGVHYQPREINDDFSEDAFTAYLDVLDNVALPTRFSPARRQRIEGGDVRAEARRLLAALGLADPALLASPVNELSIGQQQRVAAARALLGSPEILIADEPTSALDHDSREDFLQLVMAECAKRGTTLLFVSHDTSLGALFDRVISLDELQRSDAEAA